MKPIVIDTKKSDLLPISYICCDDGALLAPAAEHVVERADEDRVELAPAEEQIDRGGAEVVDRARRLGRGAHLVGELWRCRGHLRAGAHPSMKLTR